MSLSSTLPMASDTGASVHATERNVGSVERIPPGEGREFVVEGRRITVFRMRLGSEIYATQAECPHRAGPLADGLTGNGTVVCPFHAWRFDLRSGEALLGECGIVTYPARLSPDGDILVTL